MRCVRALRETRERRNINSGRFCGADVRLNGAGHELTHDRLRHDALHLGGHGARCREASETGARRGCGLLRARESGFGKAPPVARRAAGAGHARQKSHRVAARGRVALATREARPSPSSIVHKAQKKRSARNLVWAFSHQGSCLQKFRDSKRPKRASSNRFSETFLSHSLARARTRDTKTPRPPRFVSRAPWEAHGTPADVLAAEAWLGTSPLVSRASLSARTSAAAAAWISRERVASRHPRLTPFPHSARFRLVHDRVSRARLPATARTSAATTGDSSSRATTATSRIPTPTARSDQICAR